MKLSRLKNVNINVCLKINDFYLHFSELFYGELEDKQIYCFYFLYFS